MLESTGHMRQVWIRGSFPAFWPSVDARGSTTKGCFGSQFKPSIAGPLAGGEALATHPPGLLPGVASLTTGVSWGGLGLGAWLASF